MNRLSGVVFAFVWCVIATAFDAGAVDAPHIGSGYTCSTCHTAQQTLGSTGYNNLCLDCHRSGDPAAGKKPITLADAAHPYGNYTATATSKQYQTSHRWDGSDVVPAAGAQAPIQAAMTTGSLRARSGNALACVRCHNQHLNTNTPFLRTPNNQDQLCLDCHRSRNVQSHLQGSHPVNINYAAKAAAKPELFNSTPVNNNPSNPTSDLGAKLAVTGGTLLCSTCHGVHFTDSRSSTVDGSANFLNLSSGDGYLLRTDRRSASVVGGSADTLNICTNCHTGKKSHNLKNQDIQCADCHGAHVDLGDGTTPNVWLVKRDMGAGRGTVQFTSTAVKNYKDASGTGVCQSCHAVPAAGGAYPVEHNSSDAATCNKCHFHNSFNGSFSGACNACHGNPPVTATIGGPSGLASPATNAFGATPANPGAHAAHVTARMMGCNTCHNGYTTKTMPSSSIDIGFAIDGTNVSGFGGSVTGGSFTGTSNLAGYSWSAGPATTINTVATSTATCSVYCHGSTLSGGTATNPSWVAGTSQAVCGTCHGVTSAAPPTSSGHLRHTGSGAGGLGLTCNVCHGATINNDHVNGSVSWDMSGVGTGAHYKSVPVGSTGTIAPSAVYGQCGNLYCHSKGTTLSAPFTAVGVAPNTPPTWGGASLGCNGCHDGIATGPAYINGTPKANSHNKHVAAGYTCDYCHADVTTTGTTITNAANHANKLYNIQAKGGTASYTAVIGTPTTPSSCSNISCHAGNNATWGAAIDCESCHVGSVDVDVFPAPFTTASAIAQMNSTEWSSTGHGRSSGIYASGNPAAGFSGAGQCLYCHNSAVGHNVTGNAFRLLNFSDITWGKNGVCMSCHAAGSTGVAVSGVTRNSTRKIGSFHYGTSHSVASNGGQFCWDCHDGHGDGNRYMTHNDVYATSDAATGSPTGISSPVVFTAAVTGTDYAKSSAPFNGICNVCHTAAGHYKKTSGDGHNAGSRCTSCHSHNGTDILSAFAPSGGTCDSCHGYPPATASFTGGQNNWIGARSENYLGGGGAHTIKNHVSELAIPSEGFVNCSRCHASIDHKTSPLEFKPSTNIKVSVNQAQRYESAKQAKYSSNRLDGDSHVTGTCSNINCHFGATPKWDPAH